jgi:SAM-dependent methyltransferase
MSVSVPPPGNADGYFGEDVASRYDDPAEPTNSAELIDPAVDFLADGARGGPVLEFAIGTGRIALPLAARGLEVHGIELSQAMVRQMRAKPGGRDISVTIGDMSTAHVDGEFSLVYLVFNTIGNLTTQEGQVACFQNAAAHLVPGGRFVIEVGVPEIRRLAPGERYVVFDASPTHWGIDEYDVLNQGLVSHHFELVEGQWRLGSTPFRYVWPSELDLMAQLAGMRLVSRHADWMGTPFDADSPAHVSVWQKTD